MMAIEHFLLIVAYTTLSLTIFLEVICYTKKIETWETIAFTVSLLLLIVSLSIDSMLGGVQEDQPTSIYTVLAMVLVGLTTTLTSLSERKHNIALSWKRGFIFFSVLLFIAALIGHYTDMLGIIEYVVILYLVACIAFSMVLVRVTEPNKRIAHREKTERMVAIVFMVLVPLSLFVNYALGELGYELSIGVTLPIVFIILAGNKLWDDLQRLSLTSSEIEPNEQHFKNFALTQREQEIALALAKGHAYKKISDELFISIPTVKTHASNIYRKCGVKSKFELMALLVK